MLIKPMGRVMGRVIRNHDSRLNPAGDIMVLAGQCNQEVMRWPKIVLAGKNVLHTTRKSR